MGALTGFIRRNGETKVDKATGDNPLNETSFPSHDIKYVQMPRLDISALRAPLKKDSQEIINLTEKTLAILNETIPQSWRIFPENFTQGFKSLSEFKQSFGFDKTGSLTEKDLKLFKIAFYLTETDEGIYGLKENFLKVKALYQKLEKIYDKELREGEGLYNQLNKMFATIDAIYRGMGRGNIQGMSNWLDSLNECVDKYCKEGSKVDVKKLENSLGGFFTEVETVGKIVENNLYNDKDGNPRQIVTNIKIGTTYSKGKSKSTYAEIDVILTLNNGEKVAIEIKNKTATYELKNASKSSFRNQMVRLGNVILSEKIDHFVLLISAKGQEEDNTVLKYTQDLYNENNGQLPPVLIVLPYLDKRQSLLELCRDLKQGFPWTMAHLLKNEFTDKNTVSVTCLYKDGVNVKS